MSIGALIPGAIISSQGSFSHPDSLADISSDKALQLLVKRSEWVPSTSTLYIDIDARSVLRTLDNECQKRSLFVFSNILDHWIAKSLRVHSEFVDLNFTTNVQTFDECVFRLGKFNKKNLALLACIAKITKKIWIVGTNEEGVKGLSKKIAREFPELEELACEVGKGARLLSYKVHEADWESLEQKWHFVGALQHPMGELPSYNGLFAASKIDAGTDMLIRCLPVLKDKMVLDLGCGGGVLSYAALQCGAKVHAIDCNATAVQTVKEWSSAFPNLTCEGDYIASNQVDKFDIVLTNPPYHKGMEVRYNIGLEWLKQVASCLKPDGEAWVVVNSFLDYASFGKKFFSSITLVEKGTGYSVFKMVR